jgi:hypothetical protein
LPKDYNWSSYFFVFFFLFPIILNTANLNFTLGFPNDNSFLSLYIHITHVVLTSYITLDLSGYPGILFGGEGVQQIQLRTEGIENGDLRAIAP